METTLPTTVVQQTAPPFDIDELRNRQRKLGRQGRLHWVHWLIIGLSVLITIFAWTTSRSALETKQQLLFDREVERAMNLIRERIKHYEDALLSGVATMHAHDGEMSRAQWRNYAEHLHLPERYPGISGIGVIHYVETQNIADFLTDIRIEAPDFTIHPVHPYDLSLPITFVEPEQENAAAVGLDVAFEKNRRSAALHARTSGKTQISGPIVLVQDDGQTPGFLFYAPYYSDKLDNDSDWTDADRESLFKGLIYAPLVFRNLVDGVLSAENRQVSLSIRDGDTVMYEESNHLPVPLFASRENVEMSGRIWTFDMASLPALHHTDEIDQPTLVLLSGLCLEAMLFGLFWMMSRSNRQTLSMAESMTRNLVDQASKLTETNRDLESFAHVVSHDLKTPMRNIHSVVDILDEDYSDYLASNDEGLEIREYLSTLQQQVIRGESLITGILNYSTLGAETASGQIVDTRVMTETIAQQLNLSSDQFTLTGTFPTLTTNATLLEQVLSNLIGNAVKYNPNKESATVTISAHRKNGHPCFSVQDNGPGIEAHFHERIFKPFTTLNADQDVRSSGIGLSIVQRAVELQGGTIFVVSAPGSGSIFRFTWPDSQSPVLEQKEIRHG